MIANSFISAAARAAPCQKSQASCHAYRPDAALVRTFHPGKPRRSLVCSATTGPPCILLCSATGVGVFELRGLRRTYVDALSNVTV
jgi:hypothetical protein